jgi:multidrug resistance protein MdtO
MSTTVQQLGQPWPTPLQGIRELFEDELTLAPERTARMVRMTVMVMLVVLISMALRVPEAGVSAYMIFFVTRDDGPASVKSGIGLIVAVTIAVLLGLLMLCLTEGEPALRLAAVTALMFGAMYAQQRSPKVGPLGFGVGFVVTLFLTYVDQAQAPELLVRAVCWVWVAIAYPAAVVVLCEGTFGAKPEILLRQGLSRRLVAVAELLEAPVEEGGRARRRVQRLERLGTAGLAPYASRGAAALVPLRTRLVGEVQSLLVVVGQLPPAPLPVGLRASLRQAAATCREIARVILTNESVALALPPVHEDVGEGDAASLAVVLPLLASVRSLAHGVSELQDAARVPPPPPPPAAPPTAAEEEERRVNALHFASKVTLAAMSAYVLYTALDWSGIHTAMITCFFVAQESVGATIHKFTLRIVGALIGGALGILALILIVPRLDSGGGLAVMVGVVTLFAAWFGSGSQRISYLGWQIAIAFYLVTLNSFSRTTKLVGARDRALGVLLGNVLISIAFVYLWPVKIGVRIADGVSRALDALADLLSIEAGGPESEARAAQLEQTFFAGLNKAQQSAFLARFEPGAVVGASMVNDLSSLFIPARALSISAGSEASASEGLPESDRWRVETVTALRRTLALRLREAAGALREGRPPRIPEGKDAFEAPLRSFAAVTDAGLRRSLEPVRLRLEWLGMLGERLGVAMHPAGSVAAGGVR